MVKLEEPTREDHTHKGKLYRYVVWTYELGSCCFEILDRTDCRDHAENVAERSRCPVWIHELKDYDKEQVSTKREQK